MRIKSNNEHLDGKKSCRRFNFQVVVQATVYIKSLTAGFRYGTFLIVMHHSKFLYVFKSVNPSVYRCAGFRKRCKNPYVKLPRGFCVTTSVISVNVCHKVLRNF